MRNLIPYSVLALLSVHAVAQSTTLTTSQAINQTTSQSASQTTANAQTLAAQQQAAAAEAQAIQSMQGMTPAQQQAFAQNWAQTHRTAFAATAVKNDGSVNQAYTFRSHMSGDTQCQGYAQQADTVYASSTLDQDSKLQQLAQLAAQAATANCMQ